MEVSDVSADVITYTEPPAPQVVMGNIQLSCIIIKSRWPGIASKAVVVPTINGVLSNERRAEIILAERKKMADAAAALEADVSGGAICLDPDLTDRAGGGGGGVAGQLLGDPDGESIAVKDVVTGGDSDVVGGDRLQGDGAGETATDRVVDEGGDYEGR
jgi:hypothetical protein